MKCKVCGAESGKYPLCRACNIRKENGEIIKCVKCGTWHFNNAPCPVVTPINDSSLFLYNRRNSLMSKSEQSFYAAIKFSLPEGYCVFPQINLASFIDKTDDSRYRNELFRNVDFLITNAEYTPQFIIEINDQTHLTRERKDRDEKIQKICEEAGIPILKLWTSYGVNSEYISKRINETLNLLPVARVHHFAQGTIAQEQPLLVTPDQPIAQKKAGCYIATCVYNSYDCPQVWTLRRFRDNTLAETWYGRFFIRVYYAISPILVKWFGKTEWFKNLWKPTLDRMVERLNDNGVEGTPYNDREC